MTPFPILFKMTLTYQLGFLLYFFIFKQLYKMILITAVYTGKNKNMGIVFREIVNTMETTPFSPKGVFCLGVYYTRENSYKDCYRWQERSQLGAFRTSTCNSCLEFATLKRVAISQYHCSHPTTYN
jgi:hypothetical protein